TKWTCPLNPYPITEGYFVVVVAVGKLESGFSLSIFSIAFSIWHAPSTLRSLPSRASSFVRTASGGRNSVPNEVLFGYTRATNRGLHLWPDEGFQSAGRAAVPPSGIRTASRYTRYPSSCLGDSSKPSFRALGVVLGIADWHTGCLDRYEKSALSCGPILTSDDAEIVGNKIEISIR